MAPELKELDEIDWLIELSSQDRMFLEELAELFRLDDPSLHQAVTPSEVEPSVGGTRPTFSFTMEDPSSMSVRYQGSADVDMFAPSLALTKSPFSAGQSTAQLTEAYPFSPFPMGPVMDNQHDTPGHETDTVSLHISSRLEQRLDTSVCDGGVDAAIPPLSRTGVTDDNMSETQTPSLELKLEDQESTDADPTAPSGGTSDIRREAGVDTHSSQLRDALDAKRSRTPKRRHRSPLRKREELKFVTLRDIAEPNGYIKGSFPLHIHSLDMHPDPTESFMLQYRWDRREKL
ncbi:hypothetical protein QC762_0082920 [Podospora pseudocomata]|uniref:Uncharacterized protein n=1 Tax=Podospora pseudocomata TaxID=2093779 RepID=A0ABR0GCM9_9PEZI|nr:hypothetical protein QC762_0082920 [Podospora pseudocomata]